MTRTVTPAPLDDDILGRFFTRADTVRLALLLGVDVPEQGPRAWTRLHLLGDVTTRDAATAELTARGRAVALGHLHALTGDVPDGYRARVETCPACAVETHTVGRCGFRGRVVTALACGHMVTAGAVIA